MLIKSRNQRPSTHNSTFVRFSLDTTFSSLNCQRKLRVTHSNSVWHSLFLPSNISRVPHTRANFYNLDSIRTRRDNQSPVYNMLGSHTSWGDVSVVSSIVGRIFFREKHWKSFFIIKPGTHLILHRSALHQIASVSQCGQHKQPEAYTPNMLMHCADPIWSLSVHQSEHYFVCAQCGQLFCCFCCLSVEQMCFMLLWIQFCLVLRIPDQLRMCLMCTHLQ